MGKTLKTTLADKIKVKRIVKKKKPLTIGEQWQQARVTRSKYEEKVSDLLVKYKVDYRYEDKQDRLNYTVPAKQHFYKGDFMITCKSTGKKYYFETKGRFHDTFERVKYVHIAEQNPDIILVMVFQNPNLPINKGSKTTYRDFFDKHNIANMDFKQFDKLMKHYSTCDVIDMLVLAS